MMLEGLDELFPPEPYHFRLGLRRSDPAAFFRPQPGSAAAIAERRRWLEGNPPTYLAVLPEAEALVDETLASFRDWGLLGEPPKAPSAADRLRLLAEQVDPDLILLAPAETGEMRVVAGALCFPTAWRLADKLGRPMSFVHQPVPGLNAQLGQQIGAALSKLRPGAAWLRSNWSLTATDELNQHPDGHLPRLTAAATVADTWLRIERQALIALPRTGGILFAIRIESERLDLLGSRAPAAAVGLANALRTMPAEVAAYKGLAPARNALIAALSADRR